MSSPPEHGDPSSAVTPRRSGRAAPWSAIATTALLTAATAVLALHAVRPDLDPVPRRISEYAVGRHGWLMTSAFLGFATGLWALGRGVAPLAAAHPRVRPVRVLLPVAALGMALAGVFETDVTTPDAPRELVHSVASSMAYTSLVATAVWTATVARGAVEWRVRRPIVDVVTVLVVLGAIASPVTHDGPYNGLTQRLSYLAVLVWLLLLAHAAARGAGTRAGSAR